MSVPGKYYDLCLMSGMYFSCNMILGFVILMGVLGFFLTTCKFFIVTVFQYMTAAAAAAAPMQGTYIPQYTPVPPTAVPVEVRPTHMLNRIKNKKE